jgi:hypothetical protein
MPTKTEGQVKVNLPWNKPLGLRGGIYVCLYPFFDFDVRWEWAVEPTPRPLYPREEETLPIL